MQNSHSLAESIQVRYQLETVPASSSVLSIGFYSIARFEPAIDAVRENADQWRRGMKPLRRRALRATTAEIGEGTAAKFIPGFIDRLYRQTRHKRRQMDSICD
jgi:hypothetical protein